MTMLDTKGRLDIAFDPNRRYYGNGRNKPNDHCVWREDSILPGWYDDEKTYRARLEAKLAARRRA